MPVHPGFTLWVYPVFAVVLNLQILKFASAGIDLCSVLKEMRLMKDECVEIIRIRDGGADSESVFCD